MMRATWFKPNLKGALFFGVLASILLCFMPSPTYTISLAGDSHTQTTSWPWLAMGICAVLVVLLYPFSMWAGRRMPKEGLGTLLTGPLMIFPQAIVVAGFVGGFLYEPPEIHRQLGKHIFFQGNTDWGGGCLFAGTVALYVAFGFTSAWYLVLKMQESATPTSFGKSLLKAVWFLKFHIAAFVIGGIAELGYDSRVTPNDFRNMFVLAGAIYALSIVLIVSLNTLRLSLSLRLIVAPLFTVLWLIIGSDGNTARAGQLVQSGQDPEWMPRGTRHRIMLGWHQACDAVLGSKGKGYSRTNSSTTTNQPALRTD
jgi:hypothetical protein